MSKIKIVSDPVPTAHFIPHPVAKGVEKLFYRVTLVSGGGKHTPSNERIVFLEYEGGPVPNGGTAPASLSFPLERFVKVAIPYTEADKFWE